MSEQVVISWDRFHSDCRQLADRFRRLAKVTKVYGVPTGGCFVAQQLIARDDCFKMVSSAIEADLIVDDLIDSGRTLDQFKGPFIKAAVYRKPWSPYIDAAVTTIDGWIKLPWETDHGPEDAIVRLLQYLGEDPKRDGLLDTPKRVLKAMREMTEGLREDPAAILDRRFDLDHDELVLLKNISFTSLCEHHLLPFSGTAAVAYVPSGGKVVGLSKLARLVLCYAKRPQIQERLAGQVVDAIVEHLKPLGAACVISAEHSCLACRGAKLSGAQFVTSALRGVLKNDVSARAELMSLISGK